MDTPTGPASAMPDLFDRLMGQYDGLPDTLKTKAATVQVVPVLGVGGVETFILRTVRHPLDSATERQGDTVFLQHIAGDRAVKIVLPPKVTEVIARQREALTSRVRMKAAKAAAATRKAKGIEPAFLRNRTKRARRAS